jgi:hypothetical protein
MQQPYRRKKRRNGCLTAGVLLIWVAVALVLGYQFFVRPQVSRYVGRQVSERVAQQDLAQLPTVIAALPEGELNISAAQVNAYIDANLASLAPLDAARIEFTDGAIAADLQAFGVASRATMGLAVINGRIVAVQPRLEGPLAQFIALEDLIGPLEQTLNEQLAAQERRYSEVIIGEDTITLR